MFSIVFRAHMHTLDIYSQIEGCDVIGYDTHFTYKYNLTENVRIGMC